MLGSDSSSGIGSGLGSSLDIRNHASKEPCLILSSPCLELGDVPAAEELIALLYVARSGVKVPSGQAKMYPRFVSVAPTEDSCHRC
jgi:hypothetical protein